MPLPRRRKLLFLQPGQLLHRHATVSEFVLLLFTALGANTLVRKWLGGDAWKRPSLGGGGESHLLNFLVFLGRPQHGGHVI